MALTAALGRAGFTPTRLATQARVMLEQVNGAWTITAVHLETDAWVPNIGVEQFNDGIVLVRYAPARIAAD